MRVKCIVDHYMNISNDKFYNVVGNLGDYYKVLNDLGKVVLLPKSDCFTMKQYRKFILKSL